MSYKRNNNAYGVYRENYESHSGSGTGSGVYCPICDKLDEFVEGGGVIGYACVDTELTAKFGNVVVEECTPVLIPSGNINYNTDTNYMYVGAQDPIKIEEQYKRKQGYDSCFSQAYIRCGGKQGQQNSQNYTRCMKQQYSSCNTL